MAKKRLLNAQSHDAGDTQKASLQEVEVVTEKTRKS